MGIKMLSRKHLKVYSESLTNRAAMFLASSSSEFILFAKKKTLSWHLENLALVFKM